MKTILAGLAFMLFASAALAADDTGFAPVDAGTVTLDDLRWTARPIVIMAATPADPAFAEQLRLLEARWPELAARDVTIITDSDPSAMTGVRTRLRPNGFALVVIDKDGSVILRKPMPWSVREILRTIDSTPIRREELRLRGEKE